jgi:hypothetical protein
MIKKILLVLVGILVVLQFFRPEKNDSGNTSRSISTLYDVSPEVNKILQNSCNDCHSNRTNYPWYSYIEPVGWWLGSHIRDGKRHLNFDNFADQRIAFQYKRMQDCLEQLKDDDMPLGSYTLIHKNAILNGTDKETLNAWCQKIMDEIKSKYPADSLVLPKRKRG